MSENLTPRAARAEVICHSDALTELSSLCFAVRYRGDAREAILVRHHGVAYCYINQCVHMPRRLNCEDPRVFDATGRYLRCSMHGIVYEPDSGVCRSDICLDEELTALKVVERDGSVFLIDKRATLDGQDHAQVAHDNHGHTV